MPGMMDTVLNLGLNDDTVQGLIAQAGNERFGYDSYRRLIQMYGDVVMGVDGEKFEHAIDKLKAERNVAQDTELTPDDLKGLIATFKTIVQDEAGKPFPTDPYEQLWGGIIAVFASWNVPRAIEYRRIHGIPSDWGTAVNVQTMVFGNLGESSATGVAFTRDPSTGEKHFYGEFLVNAQGEDVVAGIRTPQQLNNHGRDMLPDGNAAKDLPTLEEVMPEAYQTLTDIRARLENHYRNMQDIEFTIQDQRLWMLQTRHGKRTGVAAIRIAAEMNDEGLVTPEEALLLVEPDHLDQMLHDQIDPEAMLNVLGRGLPASPGAAQGEIAFSAEDAVEVAAAGRKVVLVRRETSPEDIAGMNVAEGILTSRGGMTSHAAVVARGMGKPCVAGCGDLFVDYEKGEATIGGKVFKAGDPLTINGTDGGVIDGMPPLSPPHLDDPNLLKIMGWADETRRLKVRTNADTPHDSRQAREFGAQGIGLCRTEHMFFGEDRIMKMREMILADDETARRAALAKILPMQQEDFDGIFRAMDGLAGDHPPVGSALARVPAHGQEGHRGPVRRDGCLGGDAAAQDLQPARREPDARASRLPVEPDLSRDLRDAGRGDHRGRLRREEGRRGRPAGDHDPVDGRPARAVGPAQAVHQDRHRDHGQGGDRGRLSGRNDDRDSAGGAAGRPHGRVRRLLQLRHERPDPDDLRLQP